MIIDVSAQLPLPRTTFQILMYNLPLLSAISDLSKGSLQHTSQNTTLYTFPTKRLNWLVVSTHLKNISQNGNLPQIGVKIKNI